jgi:hypothetical protein
MFFASAFDHERFGTGCPADASEKETGSPMAGTLTLRKNLSSAKKVSRTT